jgi:hypothetical protein
VFSLFLLTAGRFHLFSLEIRSDPSKWITNKDLAPLPPIMEVSFDDLVFIAKEYVVKLDQVVQIDWMSHLGRPLYVHLSRSFGAAYFPSQIGLVLIMTLQAAMRTKLYSWRRRSYWMASLNSARKARALLPVFVCGSPLEFNLDAISRDVACTVGGKTAPMFAYFGMIDMV